MARCCNDFSRTDLLRRAAAEAGRGLPAVERGMPLPAGTGLDRRSFLARGAGLALAVYGGVVVPAARVRGGHRRSDAPPARRRCSSPSSSTAAPTRSRCSPRTATRSTASCARGSRCRPPQGSRSPTTPPPLAPLARPARAAARRGQGRGDARRRLHRPDQSHFTSRHFWEVGATSEQLRTGWLGRYLDRVGSPDNPLQGLSLDWRLPPALATAKMPVASIDGPDQYGFWTRNVWGDVEKRMLDAIGALGACRRTATPRSRRRPRRRASRPSCASSCSRSRPGRQPGFTSPVAYPKGDDEFPRRLAGLAAMLGAGLPVRVVALSAPGMYDTHDDQPQELADGLKLTADSLLAFQRDLEARGLADRVVVHVWSEFGRRAKENGSNGTDHGAAGAGFLIGSRVNGTMIGEFPGLAKLDEHGNLRATSDFRGLYSALLEQWLGADAEAIIPGARKFARPKVIR